MEVVAFYTKRSQPLCPRPHTEKGRVLMARDPLPKASACIPQPGFAFWLWLNAEPLHFWRTPHRGKPAKRWLNAARAQGNLLNAG